MQLPPMKSLPVFESVARLRSFSRAGDELNLSQSAVSHQVRQLERYLGESLFERKGRYTRLTPQGQIYYDTVSSALMTIERGTEELKGRPNTTLRLALFSSFAVRWLIPNLTALNHDYPGLTLQLEMTSESPELSDRIGDCFITLHNDVAGFEYLPIYSESLFAVCSHQYWHELQQNATRQTDGQGSLAILEQATLLSTFSIFQADRQDWTQWYDANNGYLPGDMRVQSFSHMLLALEAARHHQGVTLTNDYMFQESRDHDLIRLPFESFRTGDSFYFAYKSSRRQEPAIQNLRRWIIAMAGKTGLLGQ